MKVKKAGENIFQDKNPNDVLFKKEIYSIDNDKIPVEFAEKEMVFFQQKNHFYNSRIEVIKWVMQYIFLRLNSVSI